MTAQDNERTAIGIARAAAVAAVTGLGIAPSVLTGDPVARPCLDGLGNETDDRSADYAVPLPDEAIDDSGIDAWVDALDEPPLEDSRNDGGADPDFRMVTVTEVRDGALVTVRVGLDDEMQVNLSVLVDCIRSS